MVMDPLAKKKNKKGQHLEMSAQTAEQHLNQTSSLHHGYHTASAPTRHHQIIQQGIWTKIQICMFTLNRMPSSIGATR